MWVNFMRGCDVDVEAQVPGQIWGSESPHSRDHNDSCLANRSDGVRGSKVRDLKSPACTPTPQRLDSSPFGQKLEASYPLPTPNSFPCTLNSIIHRTRIPSCAPTLHSAPGNDLTAGDKSPENRRHS